MAQSTGLENDPVAKKKILNRLRRAHGQLAAVIDAVDDDQDCENIDQQLSAVFKAIDRAAFLAIASALQECLSDENFQQDEVDKLEKLYTSDALRPIARCRGQSSSAQRSYNATA